MFKMRYQSHVNYLHGKNKNCNTSHLEVYKASLVQILCLDNFYLSCYLMNLPEHLFSRYFKYIFV